VGGGCNHRYSFFMLLTINLSGKGYNTELNWERPTVLRLKRSVKGYIS
jgi:hypothetical protein